VKVGPDYAVSYVNWEGAAEFCKRLSAKERETYQLPTEAEWEYACRAGTTSLYPFGDDESQLWKYAEYYREVGERHSLRVGQKKPKPWGLKGMHGNVWEWCRDWYDQDYYRASPEDDPTGPTEGTARVYRGGGWAYLSGSYRPAYRGGFDPGWQFGRLGFRVARILSSE
jgi:formylglycine-generating enzyme required for sulfatase activity